MPAPAPHHALLPHRLAPQQRHHAPQQRHHAPQQHCRALAAPSPTVALPLRRRHPPSPAVTCCHVQSLAALALLSRAIALSSCTVGLLIRRHPLLRRCHVPRAAVTHPSHALVSPAHTTTVSRRATSPHRTLAPRHAIRTPAPPSPAPSRSHAPHRTPSPRSDVP
ncbi:hypothetical protein DENSPDRAFT_885007 [Dentipellis sp. KUC8613]|nr:hypothetical protein DENSPDRAFT_885007 [Dentipellis sp. KUC8613]